MRLIRLFVAVLTLLPILASCALAPGASQRPVINVVAVTYPGGAPPEILSLYKAALEVTKRYGDEFEIRISTVSPTQEDVFLPTEPGSAPPTVAALEQALGQDPPPDIVLFHSSYEYAAALNADLLVPLDSYLRNDREHGLDDYFPAAIEAVSDRGQIYAIPIGVGTTLMQYDKRIFDEAGVEVPGPSWDWTTLVSAGTRLTRGEGENQVWALNLLNGNLLPTLIWQNGGEIISKDGLRTLIGEPEAVEAIKYFYALIHTHRIAAPVPKGEGPGPFPRGIVSAVKPIGASDVPPLYGPSGTPVAMQPMTINSYTFIGFNPWFGSNDRPVRLAELPKGKVAASQVDVQLVLAMTSRAANPQLAYRVMTLLQDQIEPEVGLPARRSVAENLQERYPMLLDEEVQAIVSSLEHGRALPLADQEKWMPIMYDKLLTPLINGDKNPDEAIREAVEAIDEALNQ